MGITFDVTVELMEINCGHCGGTYAINERYRKQKEEKGDSWNCPYCQIGWGYTEGENARLKKQLEAAKQREQIANNRAESYRKQTAAARGQVTKIKNRVSNGVCPCCNRTFVNLHRHMATKHPDYKTTEEVVETVGA